jgi:MINDY deubiquitinase
MYDEIRPCSFIAICNILILREQIEILPRERKTVSYEFLAQLVGEHILLTAPKVDVSAALAMMPLTTSESCITNSVHNLADARARAM